MIAEHMAPRGKIVYDIILMESPRRWEDLIEVGVTEISLGIVDCMELPEKQAVLLAVLSLRGVFPIYPISHWAPALSYLRMTRPINRRTCFTDYRRTRHFRPIPDIEVAFKTR
jgi:hypothetical protein